MTPAKRAAALQRSFIESEPPLTNNQEVQMIANAISDAIAEEREAIAELVEEWARARQPTIVATIRARTAPTRCPTCDRPKATQEQLDTALMIPAEVCWGGCGEKPIDWRARALSAEAQLLVRMVEGAEATVERVGGDLLLSLETKRLAAEKRAVAAEARVAELETERLATARILYSDNSIESGDVRSLVDQATMTRRAAVLWFRDHRGLENLATIHEIGWRAVIERDEARLSHEHEKTIRIQTHKALSDARQEARTAEAILRDGAGEWSAEAHRLKAQIAALVGALRQVVECLGCVASTPGMHVWRAREVARAALKAAGETT